MRYTRSQIFDLDEARFRHHGATRRTSLVTPGPPRPRHVMINRNLTSGNTHFANWGLKLQMWTKMGPAGMSRRGVPRYASLGPPRPRNIVLLFCLSPGCHVTTYLCALDFICEMGARTLALGEHRCRWHRATRRTSLCRSRGTSAPERRDERKSIVLKYRTW